MMKNHFYSLTEVVSTENLRVRHSYKILINQALHNTL
jgi:hypothetical protein